MNPYFLNPVERIADWRKLRSELSLLVDKKEILEKAQEYWNQMPLDDYVMDLHLPESWSDPWEIITHGKYCKSMIAYMIMQTLLFSNKNLFNHDNMKLKLIDDLDTNEQFFILIIENKLVSNYDRFSIKNLDDIKSSFNTISDYYFDGKSFKIT